MSSLVFACALLALAFSSNFFVSADHPGHDERPTFCTSNVTACNLSGLNITCVPRKAGSSSCVEDVAEGKADLASAKADDIVKYGEKLQIVVGEQIKGLDRFIQYYGLAVVKKNATFTFKQLKDTKSCHTGVDKTVGWKIPVGYLLRTGEMTFTDNQYKSVSDFFSESCAPGIKDKLEVSQAVKNDLCSLCNSTCGKDDDYYDYEGAFKCMAEPKKRVGFVKQSTADNVFTKYGSKFGTADDYRLLCKDGSTAALTEYKTCNIGHRPASAIVTHTNKSDEMIKMYTEMLMNGEIPKLRIAGIVTNSDDEPPESLHEFSGTALAYVEGYKENVDALTPDGASTIAVSFALQIASILAFFFIF